MEERVPEIRFKGFDEPWIQQKFCNLAETRRGLTYSPDNICSNQGIRVLRSCNIDKDSFITNDNDVFVDPNVVKIPTVQVGDILITAANGSANLVGKHAIINGITPNSAIHGGFMLVASTKKPNFVNALMSASWYGKFINLFVSGGNGSIGNLNKNDLDEQNVVVPDGSEQDKIGVFFNKLDTYITLTQQKLDQLKTLKKACLEKMFPKEGETVPEIRFKGFEGPWEKKKLGNIAKETYGGGTPSTIDDSFWDGNIPWFQSSDLSEDKLFDVTQRKHISCDGLKNSSAQLISKNSIAIVTRVGVGKVAFIPYEYTTSQDFLSLSKLQTEPVFTTFALYKMLKNDSQSLQGTSIKGITKEDLLNKSILAPQEFNEQKKIGSYLHTLDELVNIQQQKLDKIKNLKKALLDKMFV